jgi:exopolysaccharide biosynthesis polyprenyl glycosylphosphotransferase
MIRRHATGLRALLMAADAVVAIAVAVALYRLHYGDTAPPGNEGSPRTLWATLTLYVLAWVALLYLVGEYRLRARWTLRGEIAGIARATVWLALVSLAALFLSDLTAISRLFLLLLFPVQGLATIATRALLRWTLETIRRRGRNVRYLLIIGTGARASDFARQVEDNTAFGLQVVGFLGDPPAESTPVHPYLGPTSAALNALHDRVVDEVAICLPRVDYGEVEEIVRVCQEEGKIIRIPLDAPQIESGLRFVEDLNGTAVLSVLQGPDRVLSLALKRAFDIAVAGLALVLLSPIILGAAIYIRARDGAPILFRQTRVGVHGRKFTILKFRTMVRDADERYPEVEDQSTTNGPAFKMASDPRVTPWGRFLRRTSIDELPQLINVLRGNMSLVGPRPAPPREVNAYNIWHRRRLSMKPGMTGLWQISSRLDKDFDDRAKLDLDYIDRWSIWLDLRIVARTFPAVFHLQGR